MDILKFPNPILVTKTYAITTWTDEFKAELKNLLDSMYELMKKEKGIGLAANQIGLLHRMFVMDGPDGRVNIINPQIVSKSRIGANIKEGCLSAPGDSVLIPTRAQWVQFVYHDENGDPRGHVFSGVHAVCVQHEIDHLDGKVFFADKSIPKIERKLLMKKWGIK
jgi:peptide deformylase